jgi:UDP-N-acetylglucosamine--N-acetylmuramyl-(pentapeptide) pyrophosphoryl-undecaprenol N-acetylglucosamine transferase
MTVSEVAALGLPAIFVPLPSAIDDHQTANARYLTEANAGVLLMQKHLTPDILAEKINEVIANLSSLSNAATQCARLDATEKVAQFCVQAANS